MSQPARVVAVAAHRGTFYGQAMTAGDIYTVAGNGTTRVLRRRRPGHHRRSWTAPPGRPADAAGNLVIADAANQPGPGGGGHVGHVLRPGDDRRATSTPWPATARRGYSGDGGPATAAELTTRQGVAVDGAGNLVIADTGNNRVRVVAASTGTFYGQAMTAGRHLHRGRRRHRRHSGDGGPATARRTGRPGGVDGGRARATW